ncbi:MULTISPECIES: Nif3-like dinuclear metal center hexameric protein [Bacillus]|uniref:Nif3-like dinuclear metal center hexameric protein n=1 Tax=Bacillus TaxID=1386 RepID=UPI00046964D3|nr:MULTISPECIES: Nif3-like dinuclear metal center hexameric protein [Bacillus]MED1408333.1 Nif3-like dinuclear metal center hexameric protein [Bacillus paramycoides]MED1462299.1 Nif3-like dinuclear metal center hexameric protein [Bacillus paramycoides]MED1494258.1 Nif3-like dinuclear metal center hexameric protein [Bacillus paramycoides]
MNITQFNEHITSLFEEHLNKYGDDEYGFTHISKEEFHKIGYTTNLTLETIEEAYRNGVDMILTHHAPWSFLFGMEEACIEKLKQYEMNHFWIHLPLDFVKFGTCTSLFKEIGIDTILEYSTYEEEELPGIGEYEEAIPFSKLVEKLEEKMEESVKSWENHDRPVKRIAILTGAGNNTNLIERALAKGCDTYITGEKTLYTVQHAKFKGINLIVGSHTFTEVFGVESLARKLKGRDSTIEITRLNEEHLE